MISRREVETKLREVERELNHLAHSDTTMGVYDIEHLKNARELIRCLLREL